jgi:hypothetical protein
MNPQINSADHIAGREALSQQAQAGVASALGHPSLATVFDAGYARRARPVVVPRVIRHL